MNRVLNVILISGLACTLACAPGSRHQQVAKKADNKAPGPKATPGPTPTMQQASPDTTVVSNPAFVQNNIDTNSMTLKNVEVMSNATTPGSLVIKFLVEDSNHKTQLAALSVDGTNKPISTDANFSGINYTCSDTSANVVPANCGHAEVKFTWNKIASDAIVTLVSNLSVVEAIGGGASQPFGKGIVQKLDFTFSTSKVQNFSRINAQIAQTNVTPGPTAVPDDKQMSKDDSNISISVFGLPKVDFDNKGIRPVETLNGASGRTSSVAMSAKTATDSMLIYTLGVMPADTATPVRNLTLTITSPLSAVDISSSGTEVTSAPDEKDGDTNSADKAATEKAATDKAATDKAAADKTAADKAAADKAAADKAAGKTDGASDQGVDSAGGNFPGAVDSAATSDSKNSKKTSEPKAAATKKPKEPQVQEQPRPDLTNHLNGIVSNTQPQPPTDGITQKDFCAVQASVGTTDERIWVNVRIDLASNNLVPNPSEWMTKEDKWQSNYCDATTGRLADRSDAPDAVACLSRWIKDSHTETIIFSAPDLKNPGSCYGRLAHYRPGIVDSTGCTVRPIDNFSLHAIDPIDTAAWSMADNVVHKGAPAMTPIKSNPGQFQMHTTDNVYGDIFYQPTAPTSELQCWGRTTMTFKSQK